MWFFQGDRHVPDSSMQARLAGWRCVTEGPLGLEEGPALDGAGLEALAAWGRDAGLAGPPGAWLMWANCD